MTRWLMALGIAVLTLGALALRRRHGQRTSIDPAWAPTGTRQTFSGYDYERARAARKRERDKLKARVRAAQSAEPKPRVVAFEKRRVQ